MINFIITYWIQFLLGIVASILMMQFKKISEYKKRLDYIDESVQVMLKHKISETYERVIQQEYISMHDKDFIIKIYGLYKVIGHNGLVKELMKDINQLPIEKL